METTTKVDTSKKVFQTLASIFKTSAIQIYTKYLDNSQDFFLDFSALSDGLKIDNEWAKNLYGNDDSIPPRFFDCSKSADWARLNKSVMPKYQSLCFYQMKASQRHGSKYKKFFKIYDESCITRLFNPQNNIKRHIFVLYKDKDNIEDIKYVPNGNFDKKTVSRICPKESESNFMQISTSEAEKNATHAEGYNLNECINTILNTVTGKQISIPQELTFDKLTSNNSLFSEIENPVVLCCHRGGKVTWRGKNSKTQNLFTTLACYNERSSLTPLVLCITTNEKLDKYTVYTPNYEIRPHILKHFVKPVDRVTGVNQYLTSKCKSVSKDNEEDPEEVTEWWQKYKCRCDCCSLAKDNYSKNVSIDGVQPKVTIDLDTLEYMTIFNLKNEENIEMLKEVYALSVTAVDLESYTKKIDHPRKVENISTIGRGSEVIGVQQISLIGYGDHLTVEGKEHYKIFESSESTRQSAQEAVNDFIDHILERQKLISTEKETLLQPLYEFINAYKEAHFTFWRKEFCPNSSPSDSIEKKILKCYDNTLVGKFEKHLNKLKNSFFCFAFNGGGYDFPMLHKLIATCLKIKGKKKPLNSLKKSSKFLRMSIPNTGIQFVDICDMLGPGSSLASFSALTGQKDAKMIFPFGAFTSPSFLKRKQLPTNKDDWYNDLKQCETSDEDIRKAHEDFKRVKAQNIGEYLKSYLKSKYISCKILCQKFISFSFSGCKTLGCRDRHIDEQILPTI